MKEVLDRLAAAGCPEVLEVSAEEFHSLVLPACFTAFSDGEIDARHRRLEGDRGILYGTDAFSAGKLVRTLTELASEGKARELQHVAGRCLALVSESVPLPSAPMRLNAMGVCIGGMTLPVVGGVKHVVEYGPGLAGRTHVEAQYSLLRAGKDPFAYTAISRRIFTSAFLETISRICNANNDERAAPALTCLSDGIAAALPYVKTESADVVLCTNLQKADPVEVRQGLLAVGRVLREGGALVVRSVAQPAFSETDARQMTAWAVEGGMGSPVVQHEDIASYDVVCDGRVEKVRRQMHTAVLIRE